MNAMDKIEQAFNAKRQEMYGDIWEMVDWYGLPKSGLSEAQKSHVMAVRSAQLNAEYNAYKGAA